MDFVFDLPVPANTSKDEPEELEVDVGVGIVHLVELEIARGCKGEVYAAVRQGLHQVWPTNPDGAYHSDGRVYSRREHYEMTRGAPPLVLQGWSPGTSYAHNVQFTFSILPVEIMEPWRYQQGVMDTLLRLLGVKPKKGR